jgi:LytS/YehU family sensor histidine kinase
MVARRDEGMTVEDFLSLDRERLDQKFNLSVLVDDIYEDITLPPFEPFRGFRKRMR